MPLPDDSGDEGMPKELQAISNDMQQRYRTSENWWQTSDETSGSQYFQSAEESQPETVSRASSDGSDAQPHVDTVDSVTAVVEVDD